MEPRITLSDLFEQIGRLTMGAKVLEAQLAEAQAHVCKSCDCDSGCCTKDN